MTTPIRQPSPITVTGLPADLVGVVVESVTETLGPQPDQIVLRIPIGRVRTPAGTVVEQYPSPAMRGEIAVSADGWSVKADILHVREAWSAGRKAALIVTAFGDAIRLEHTYPSLIGDRDIPVINVPGGWRTPDATGPDGTYLISPRSGLRWTQAELLRALWANVVAAGDLPATTITIPETLLTGTKVCDLRGQSLIACVQELIGGRAAAWRLTRSATGLDLALIDPHAAGATLDLRGPWISQIDHDIDGTATVADLEVVAGYPRTVTSWDHYVWSGNGALTRQSWNIDDNSVLLSVPGAGDLQSYLPVSPSGLSTGDNLTAPIKCFVHARRWDGTAWSTDYRWQEEEASVAAVGRNQIMVSGANILGRTAMRGGGGWVQVGCGPGGTLVPLATVGGDPVMDRIRLVLCTAASQRQRHLFTGGAGRGRSRRDTSGGFIAVSSLTPWGVTTGGSLNTIGPMTGGTSTADLIDDFGPDWEVIKADRSCLRWSERGRHGGGLPPGSVVSQAILPGPTAVGRTVPCQGVVLSRTTSWDQRHRPRVTCTIGWPSVAGSL